MDFVELKNKSEAELNELVENFRNELRLLRFKLKGRQLKQHQKYGALKSNIARIETLLSARRRKKPTLK